MAALSPDLPDELVHEILFRLPPDEPACLVCLSVVSKPWRCLLSDPAFHHHYRKFHQTPPMLGFLYNSSHVDELFLAQFVPTTGSCPPCTLDPQLSDLAVCFCREGRVLLDYGDMHMKFVVWNPMTGRQREIRYPNDPSFYIGTAVLCAVDGCDHATCHEGPFHVVFVGGDALEGIATAYLYSSETGEWSTPTYEIDLVDDSFGELGLIDGSCYLEVMHSVLVGETLHFLFKGGRQGARVLKYDMGRHCLSVINPPAAATVHGQGNILMALEDGSLGIAHLDKLMLHLWSREAGPDRVAAWTQHRAIDLRSFIHIGDPTIKVVLIGSMEGAYIIFTTTSVGIYAIDLKSLQSRKLCERQNVQSLFPFMSFYYPPGIVTLILDLQRLS
ncbi:hypothetical protein ACQ4PT_048927 [Festuca glaucescens]